MSLKEIEFVDKNDTFGRACVRYEAIKFGLKLQRIFSFAQVLIIKRKVHNSKRTRKKCKILHLLSPRFLTSCTFLYPSMDKSGLSYDKYIWIVTQKVKTSQLKAPKVLIMLVSHSESPNHRF